MKFGKTLVKNQVPQWADHYISYKALKKLIVDAVARKKQLGGQPVTEDDVAVKGILFY